MYLHLHLFLSSLFMKYNWRQANSDIIPLSPCKKCCSQSKMIREVFVLQTYQRGSQMWGPERQSAREVLAGGVSSFSLYVVRLHSLFKEGIRKRRKPPTQLVGWMSSRNRKMRERWENVRQESVQSCVNKAVKHPIQMALLEKLNLITGQLSKMDLEIWVTLDGF